MRGGVGGPPQLLTFKYEFQGHSHPLVESILIPFDHLQSVENAANKGREVRSALSV